MEYNEGLAKRASETVRNVEWWSAIIWFILTMTGALCRSAIPFIIIISSLILIIIWEHWYNKKYHYSTYNRKIEREKSGIIACPYCGNMDLKDTNGETICEHCNKILPSKMFWQSEQTVNPTDAKGDDNDEEY